MPATQRSHKRPPKATDNGGSASRATSNEKGAGLWIFFPVLMVVLGVVVGILWEPSTDTDGAEAQGSSPAKSSIETVGELL